MLPRLPSKEEGQLGGIWHSKGNTWRPGWRTVSPDGQIMHCECYCLHIAYTYSTFITLSGSLFVKVNKGQCYFKIVAIGLSLTTSRLMLSYDAVYDGTPVNTDSPCLQDWHIICIGKQKSRRVPHLGSSNMNANFLCPFFADKLLMKFAASFSVFNYNFRIF